MSWSFDGVGFSWSLPTVNGLATAPAWQRAPRLVERPLLETGDADISQIGFSPWRIEGPILVSAANAAALLARNGSSAVLTDGTSTWTAVATISLSTLYEATQGATGTASFVRARA